MKLRTFIGQCCLTLFTFSLAWLPYVSNAPVQTQVPADFTTEIRQVSFGSKHHFFGYIGHVRTIPWNQSGSFAVALQTDFQERMPNPGEAAEIILLDARNNYTSKVIDRTRAWNFQQGTMLYWNPSAPETQFFFNDRDP